MKKLEKITLQALGISEEEMKKEMKKAEKKNLEEKGITEVFNERLAESLDDMKISKRLFKGVTYETENLNYIRDLVKNYYQMQGNRVRSANQEFALKQSEKDNIIATFFTSQLEIMELNIATFMDDFTTKHPIGIWLRSVYGIGPVLAAGLLSMFDVTKTNTAGGFWRYIGWEGGPERKERKRGCRVDYNPTARTLVWKAAHSFRMGYKNKKNFYGQLYARKKEFYIEKNEAGGFTENAERELSRKKWSACPTKEAYESGKLPASHIDAMAMRFSAKIFLSHLFDIMFMYEYGKLPPAPYVNEHAGHVHIDRPVNLDVILPYLKMRHPNTDWDALMKIYLK